MNKVIGCSGQYGSFDGTIEVKLDYKVVETVAHNRSTHDDEVVKIRLTKVIGKIGGEVYEESRDIDSRNKEEIVKAVDKIEKQLRATLEYMATHPKVETLKDILTNKGYR